MIHTTELQSPAVLMCMPKARFVTGAGGNLASDWFIITETSVRNESFNKYILTIHNGHFKYLCLGGAKVQTGVSVKCKRIYM